jgi:hypothetical protein
LPNIDTTLAVPSVDLLADLIFTHALDLCRLFGIRHVFGSGRAVDAAAHVLALLLPALRGDAMTFFLFSSERTCVLIDLASAAGLSSFLTQQVVELFRFSRSL